jgi:hypothetical protein
MVNMAQQTSSPPRVSITPVISTTFDARTSESTRRVVQELRNRLLVFYSASAWARARTGYGSVALQDASSELEHAAESLRATLNDVMGALDHSRGAIRHTTPSSSAAVERFLGCAESAMGTLRGCLMLCESDGLELLADLEEALARVRDSANHLSGSRRPSLRLL